MLEFKVNFLAAKGRAYLLLPKLNRLQLAALSEGLTSSGYKVGRGRTVQARRKGEAIHIDPAGVCWSVRDSSDSVLPLIPRVLELKEETSLEECREKYYSHRELGGGTVVRFDTRAEGALWRPLRAADDCALTPDEQAVAVSIIRRAGRRVLMVTDFSNDSSRLIRVGGRILYETVLSPDEAVETLRSTESKGSRNSYLPANGAIALPRVHHWPGPEVFQSLGEWFGFKLPDAKALIRAKKGYHKPR